MSRFIQELQRGTLDFDLVGQYVMKHGASAAGALLTLILGRLAAKWLTRLLRRVPRKGRMDETLVTFLSNVLYIILLVLVLTTALEQIGVKATSVAAVIAAAGLAIGLSLQSSLSNFASGVLLIAFRPFRVGDYITAGGQSGTVEEVNIFTTHLRTSDNAGVVLPNSTLTSGSIVNLNAKATRRIDFVFPVGYQEDIARVRRILREIIDAEPRILKDPPEEGGVLSFTEHGVQIALRPWVKTEHYWPVLFAVQEEVKRRFDAEGIVMPQVQRVVCLPPQEAERRASQSQ
jgi:small conductance mechanosensitive channel